ncbi:MULTISPECIES: LPXTG cell wall anchor domain-containing protein [unclassified Ruminococcus]|uniref:LPXTG cell wall anchor domain-containing protein n=1 Tax=unclassified Ruminococcus TaxID=2608920 RepID=UPI00210C0B18|nr:MULTISPECIES: LPXTG cell wall anchor domain-containing protein [unclassified Ruminococcus]MCQ4022455.1 LPXTG cell wall anchor domain-containing protein [Ruminococcus sp. zg-924]MCQ4115719.1 LPXTG cell wall anchor domain-containing protein [Ruminococcus sp. zg-921]
MKLKKILIPLFSLLAIIMSAVTASAANAEKAVTPTGDETNVFLIVAILVAAVAVAVVVIVLGKKNNK